MKDDEQPTQPHDALFRVALERPEDARSALEAVLPPTLVAQADWSTFRRLPSRFTTLAFQQREGDLLFAIKIAGRLTILWPVEHQSSIDRFMALRLLRGQLDIWEAQRARGEQLTPVIPLVVHHGPRPWSAPQSMLELLAVPDDLIDLVGPHTPSATYIVDDLARLDPEALARRTELSPFVRVAYFLLQRARVSTAFATEFRMFRADVAALADAQDGGRALRAIVRYAVVVADGDPRHFMDALEEASRTPSKEVVMVTLADRFVKMWREEAIAEGRAEGLALGFKEGAERGLEQGLERGLEQGLERGLEQGLERGLEQGRAAGAVDVLKRILAARFGDLPSELEARLASIPADRVGILAERALTVARVEDLFDDGV